MGLGAKNSAADAAAEEYSRRATAIRQGTENIDAALGGFGDQFYQQRKQAYLDFALPELQTQYGDAKRALTFGAANRGIYGSSIAGDLGTKLARDMTSRQVQLVNESQRQADEARKSVEGQRTTLYNQLLASQDPSMAQSQALQSAATLNVPPAWLPVGRLLETGTYAMLGNRMSNMFKQEQESSKTKNYFAPIN